MTNLTEEHTDRELKVSSTNSLARAINHYTIPTIIQFYTSYQMYSLALTLLSPSEIVFII